MSGGPNVIKYGGNIDACIQEFERMIAILDQKRLLTNWDYKTTIPAMSNLADDIRSFNVTRDVSVDILKNDKEMLKKIKEILDEIDKDIAGQIDDSRIPADDFR